MRGPHGGYAAVSRPQFGTNGFWPRSLALVVARRWNSQWILAALKTVNTRRSDGESISGV